MPKLFYGRKAQRLLPNAILLLWVKIRHTTLLNDEVDPAALLEHDGPTVLLKEHNGSTIEFH